MELLWQTWKEESAWESRLNVKGERQLTQAFFLLDFPTYFCNLYTYIQMQSANCVLRSEGG
jgi:hypothetical protein